MSAAAWIREQREIYFGNAELKKDYRVRLRGNRVAWVLAFYLGLFLIVTLGIFQSIAGGQISVVEAQSRLQDLYVWVTIMLEALALFVAPAVACSNIVAEHQRKSDELIFVSPITLKYFLVGKLLSGLRYLLVLFALALPMAAACVVFGGATWREVVLAYVILCFRSCFYLALALPIAAATKKVVPAFILTLLAIGFLAFLGSFFGASGLLGASGMTGSMGLPGQVPFYSYILPFTSALGADTFTLI
ncbi:MAG: ABC transporter permease, partial [Fimbriimonadaceae bacterium]